MDEAVLYLILTSWKTHILVNKGIFIFFFFFANDSTETQRLASGGIGKAGNGKMAKMIPAIHILQISSHISGCRLTYNGGCAMPAGVAFTLLGRVISPEVRAYPEVHPSIT